MKRVSLIGTFDQYVCSHFLQFWYYFQLQSSWDPIPHILYFVRNLQLCSNRNTERRNLRLCITVPFQATLPYILMNHSLSTSGGGHFEHIMQIWCNLVHVWRFLQRGRIACNAEHCISHCNSVRPSVCPSDTGWYCTQTNEDRSCGLYCEVAETLYIVIWY